VNAVSARDRSAAALSCFEAGVTVGDLMALLGEAVELRGRPDASVAGVATFRAQAPQSLSYLVTAGPPGDAAQIVLCAPDAVDALAATTKLVAGDPRAAFLRLIDRAAEAGLFDEAETVRRHAAGIAPGAFSAHASAIIEGPVVIGEGVQIGPNAVIRVGAILGPGVVVRSGAVIGDEGAAVHRAADGELLAQRHLGTVRLEAGCEVGIQAAVVRAMFGSTRVGEGTRLGNFVNVGHGCEVGARAWIAAGAILGGHCTVGDGATHGRGAVERDNVEVCERAYVRKGSVLTKSVPAGASVFGNPAKVLPRPIATGPAR
jgi:UDP-3-O-[3-hydroxymyristoyl] glucosamine N-acyltransferase